MLGYSPRVAGRQNLIPEADVPACVIAKHCDNIVEIVHRRTRRANRLHGMIMNQESTEARPAKQSSTSTVIPVWLSAGLVISLVGSALLSGALIVKLGSLDTVSQQTLNAQVCLERNKAELASLEVAVESLKKQRDVMAPTLVDWEKRLKEKAAAEAALAVFEAKQKQAESDILQLGKRLEQANADVASIEKQKASLISEADRFRAETAAAAKGAADAKATLATALETERRLTDAQNGLTKAESERKQADLDLASARTRLAQLQNEGDDLRKSRDKLAVDEAALRQQVQSLKEQLSTTQDQAAVLKAKQNDIQSEDQKFLKLQQSITIAEAHVNELNNRQKQAAAEFGQATNQLDTVRKDMADWAAKRDTAHQSAQRADEDLFASRKLLSETDARRGELVKEQARLDEQVSRLKKEKESLEAQVGHLEGQKTNAPTGAQ